MNKFLSLHIGVNRVDAASYAPTKLAELCGCINDACVMADVATTNGFEVMNVLRDSDATFNAVIGGLEYAVTSLHSGDAFLFTFSGHGVRLATRPIEEVDRHDEGLVLYDLILKDNYLNTFLRRFRAGVRVILVADCCHSRTIHSFGADLDEEPDPAPADRSYADPCRRNRRAKIDNGPMSNRCQKERYKELDYCYNLIGQKLSRNIEADVILLSACDDNEMAADGPENGLFTKSMLDVLRNGADSDGIPFMGSYDEFIKAIRPRTGNAQIPGATLLGPNADTASYLFFQGPPFTLNNWD